MTTRDPTDLRVQERDAEADQQKLTRKDRQAQEDLKWLLAHRPGRRIAWRMLEQGQVFGSVFHTSGSVMAFNEGRRNLALQLLNEIMTHAPEAFTLMQREAKADE